MAIRRFEDGPDFIRSLARGLQVIRAFDRDHPSRSLSEVAETANLPRAAARRCLLTLRHLGYVGSRGRLFFLTPRVLELGFSYLSSWALPELALPHMERLSRRIDESCSMSVLDGSDIVYVARVPVRRVMTISLGVGARLPAFATSMGRALISGLTDAALDRWLAAAATRALTPYTVYAKPALKAEVQKVRAQGHALVVQELELGLCSVAVPIRDRSGTVVSALNVGLPYRTGVKERVSREILPALHGARVAIEAAIAPLRPPEA
jgi:IclR family pca regulon transcriptional regulator